jgi:hypothetical protein
MGFPYAEATWDAATGAIYMGAGGPMPMIYTLISAALCIWALWAGNRKEHALYEKKIASSAF